MDRWDDHLCKWERQAKERDIEVEYVRWGSSELLDRLSREEHSGRRFFWFGQHEFSQDWFSRHLNESLSAVGPRYTPEVHVDLPIAQDLKRFSRSSSSFEEVKSLSLGIRRAHDSLVFVQRSADQQAQDLELDCLASATSKVLEALAQLEACPAGHMRLPEIVNAADKACNEGTQVLEKISQLRTYKSARPEDIPDTSGYFVEPLKNMLAYVQQLQIALGRVIDVCTHVDSLANNQLLLLKGDGGTGKTHLICDFAKRRVEDQLPTLVLVGKRFLSADDPWVQLLQQLDLSHSSAEEFVGALESAAQASACRAMVMIDALNEGNGRRIWPAHLPSFLARIQESPWIGVVLSVRSSYEETIIPKNVRDRATVVTHQGFAGLEFDATRIFFAHYGLQAPSTPILQPEFSNPLFLKAICEGLQGKGERQLPRGFHGVSAVFDLYLNAIHERLRKPEYLNYDPKNNLVRQSLERLAERFAECGTPHLRRSEAQAAVDNLLPGRNYDESLYAALVAEGILAEDIDPSSGVLTDEVVTIVYDRFADHIISDHLLNTHLDRDDPSIAFSENGGMALLSQEERYIRYGIIEALCIQVPERIGQELVSVAPSVRKRPMFTYAFLQSIIWRKHDAFSKDFDVILDDLLGDDDLLEDFLDTMVSLSTISGHPFNAETLDRRLREDAMPDRDSWWSTYLHRAWQNQSPVDRLIDWALSSAGDEDIEDEVVDLAATTLSWMLTTPNRFLRDRATKALVVLLTGRFESAGRLVNRFADVDDPYVSERVHAVAYGVAMRSHDADAVGKLALLVYDRVFASGDCPPHILLRDYARGVVERAIYLGAEIPVNDSLIRPPYRSIWPDIPGEEIIEQLTPHWNQGAWVDGDLEWSRNRIRHSVLGDLLSDFSRYVIGSESNSCWLSLRLDEAQWVSPEERIEDLLDKLGDAERAAYASLRSIENEPSPIFAMMGDTQSDGDAEQQELSRDMDRHEERIEASRQELMSMLTDDQRSEMEAIDHARSSGPPRFDVRAIQRYVFWRVFDLGWTIDRFGEFDRFFIGDPGRSANKPERMGKKYQWIAYHEILAHLSDHYQYQQSFFGDEGGKYEGPWQLHVRDIDPSSTLSSTPGGTSWGPHKAAWWGDAEYAAWRDEVSHQEWLALETDIPRVEDLLQVVRPNDGSQWVNLCGNAVWRQPHPVDVDPFKIERRELMLRWEAYFVHSSDVDSFVSWAKRNENQLDALPESPTVYLYYMFFGEYGWSPAFRRQFPNHNSTEGWAKSEGERRPVDVRTSTVSYSAESGVFDCSVDEHYTLLLPHHVLLDDLDLNWSGRASDFVDKSGRLAIYDPTAHDDGPTTLLMDRELLERYLRQNGLVLCWVVFGEKWIVGGARSEFQGHLKISGAFRHAGQAPEGNLSFSLVLPD